MNTLSGVKDRFLLDTLSAVRSGGILKKIWIYSVILLNDFNFTCIVQLRFVQIFQIFLNTWFIVPKRCLIFCLCCIAVYAEQRVVGKPPTPTNRCPLTYK